MAQILILFEHTKDRRLLNEYLSVYFKTRSPNPADFKKQLSEPFDLCILDSQSYSTFATNIRVVKSSSTSFLPFLLAVSQSQQKLKQEAMEIVDELVVIPVGPVELRGRIKTLLRTRSLSLQLNALLEDHQAMLAMVSHDIRSPLTAVRLQAELLLKNLSLDSKGKHLVQSIINNTGRMNRMIDDLLDLGRNGIGDIEVNSRPIQLKEFLSRLLANEHFTQGAERVRIEIPDDFPTIIADTDRLDRIFTNLISNALKYASGSDIVIRAHTVGDEAVIEVTDYGPGIDPKFVPRIFDRYFRVMKSEKHTRGLGIGLYITKLLVEAHGGRIWVTSQLGKGTTFSFGLQLKKPAQRAA